MDQISAFLLRQFGPQSPAFLKAIVATALLLSPAAAMAQQTSPREETPTAEALSADGTEAPSVQELGSNGNITIRLSSNNVETFYPAYLANLSRTYVKLTGVDLEDDRLVDEFAALNYCDIYTSHFKDEFAWRQARASIRKIMQDNLESFPEHFYIDGQVQLGRYNFETKSFEIAPESRFQRTGMIRVAFANSTICPMQGGYSNIPTTYRFRLTNPITLDAIPVSEGMAYQLSRLLDQQNSHARIINVSLFMRVNDFSNSNSSNGAIINSTVRATLLTMRFYLDNEHKVFIYENKMR